MKPFTITPPDWFPPEQLALVAEAVDGLMEYVHGGPHDHLLRSYRATLTLWQQAKGSVDTTDATGEIPGHGRCVM